MNLKEVDLAQCPFSARLLQVHGFKIARWTFLKTTTKAEVDGLTQLVELVVDHVRDGSQSQRRFAHACAFTFVESRGVISHGDVISFSPEVDTQMAFVSNVSSPV